MYLYDDPGVIDFTDCDDLADYIDFADPDDCDGFAAWSYIADFYGLE
jgi:hypothetical protein